MDTIKFLWWGYVELFTSWWWLALATVTFVSLIAFVLKDDDYTLTTGKAVQLALVGIVNMMPLVKKLLPNLVVLDFLTRWLVLGLNSFWSFTLVFSIISFLFAPVFFLIVFGFRLYDNFDKTALSVDN